MVVMGLLLLCSALCSSSETALFSLQDSELRQRQDDFFNVIIKRLLASSERLLMAILLVNNAVNVAFFALASYWGGLSSRFPSACHYPRCFGLAHSPGGNRSQGHRQRTADAGGAPGRPFWITLITVIKPLILFFERVLKPIINPDNDKEEFPEIEADELKLVVEQSHHEGVVSSYVHDRLVDVIDLSQVPVHKVMTHRWTVAPSPSWRPTTRPSRHCRAQPSSHILVLDDAENCVGILGAQHLIKKARPARRLKKPLVIPGVVTLAQALELMQRENANAGIVVDEYGGTDGLLTLAHLAQVLLGESVEDNQGTVRVEQVDADSWRISGNAPIDPWTSLLNSPTITDEVATIGGFMAHVSGSIPNKNDRLLFNNILFVVEDTEGMRVKTVLVKKLNPREARRLTQQGVL